MEQLDKWILFALIAVGKREAALERIRSSHRVNDEDAARLLQALAAESPLPELNSKRVLRWAGMGVFVLGLILAGIGLAFYFSYESNDEREMIRVKGTVTDVRDFADGLEITLTYTYREQPYTRTERSDVFRKVGLAKGQEMDLVINAANPEEAFLLALKPFVQASGLRYGLTGLGLIVISILLWRWMVSTGRAIAN